MHPFFTAKALWYRRNLPHWYCDHAQYFLSFNTHHRRRLSNAAKDEILRAFIEMEELHTVQAAVMPDHCHAIVELEVSGVAGVLKRLKGGTARVVNLIEGTTGSRVWQEESFDRVIRNDQEFSATYDYIRLNPVVAGLVQATEKYEWYYCRWSVEHGEMADPRKPSKG